MSRDEKKETMVFVKGKLVPLSTLEKEYPDIAVGRTEAQRKVLEVLLETEKPLNKAEIAKQAGLSEGHTRHVLKQLMKNKYVLEFHFASRMLYYLLTEKGASFAKETASS